jgi:hypothetical protein
MAKKKSTTTKKAVAAVAAAATLAACSQMQMPSAEREITLSLSGVRTGQMLTKGPLDVLAQTLPTKMPTLTLQSKTVPERRYTMTPGVPAPVALDSYTVTGTYLPNEEGKVFGGSAYATPPFSVNAEITVTEDVSEYSVGAAYDCFALVLDESTTEKYRIRGYAGAMMDLAWVYGSDGYKVVYLKGEFLDAVYLQQNTFDPIDSACSSERQRYVFAKVLAVLRHSFDFEDKTAARDFFNQLRQAFIDWNYAPWQGEGFAEGEKNVDNLFNSK